MSVNPNLKKLEMSAREEARKEAAKKKELLRRVSELEQEVQQHRRTLAAIVKHLGIDPKATSDDDQAMV